MPGADGRAAVVSGQEDLPPFSMPLQENRIRKAVACGMLPGNIVPAPMLNGNPGAVASWLEPHRGFRDLVLPESRLPPGKSETDPRLPCGDTPDLELFAVRKCLGEAALGAWFKSEQTRTARGKLEQRIGAPSYGDIAGENLERLDRRGSHPQ